MLAIVFVDVIRDLLAASAGVIIGGSFGLLQSRALRKNEERRDRGDLNSHWRVMLSSPRRIVWFLLCLVAIQVLCPALFVAGAEWWVSGGVALGYGLVQFNNFRRTRLMI